MKNIRSRIFKQFSNTSTYDENLANELDGVIAQTNLQETENKVLRLWTAYKFHIQCTVGIIVFILYNAFLIMAVIRKDNWNVTWCHGIKVILIITFISYAYLFYYKVAKVLLGQLMWNYFKLYDGDGVLKMLFKYPIFHVICFAILACYVLFISITSIRTFIAYSGIWILLLLGFVFSKHHAKIHWRQICWGLNLQLIIGLLVLHFQFPSQLYYCIMEKSSWIGSQADNGASFVFGYLISGEFKSNDKIVIAKQNSISAFQMFSDTVVFSMFIGILHHYKISYALINYIGRVAYMFIGCNTIESNIAITSVFVAFKDSIMFLRNYLPYINNAELHSICVIAMATNARSIYRTFFVADRNSYSIHRVLASVMAFPSALTMTRLLYPELETTKLTKADVNYIANNVNVYNNIGESVVRHIFDAIRLSGAIIATGIVFAVFPFMLDDFIEWFAIMAGLKFNFTWLLANVLTPCVYIVGIEWRECFDVARAIATQLLYEDKQAFEVLQSSNLSKRAQTLAIYLLGDRATIIHLAFSIAAISVLVPSRLPNFVDILARAFVTTLLTSWLSACVTGCLMTFSNYQEPFQLDIL